MRAEKLLANAALAGLLMLLAVRALPPAQAQGAAASGLRVNLYVDERRNKAAIKTIGEEFFRVHVYRDTRASDGAIRLQPASEDLLGLWKGNAVLTGASDLLWESPDQFTPVLLVLDVTNEGTAPAEISRAYLRVADSQTDRQPFVRMGRSDGCGGVAREVYLFNDGWRTAENATLAWRFGNTTAGPEFRADLGAIGNVAFAPDRALATLMPALDGLRARPPRCARAQIAACLARLEGSGQLGRLAGLVRFEGGRKLDPQDGGNVNVTVPMTGTLSYQWKHHPSNETRPRQQPFAAEIGLFVFDTGQGPECGAAGPNEGGFNPIKLQLDTGNYQVPLPYRGSVGARGNRRFEVALKADRASNHRFEVVLETSDGRIATSPPVDLLYFVPTKNRSPMRELR